MGWHNVFQVEIDEFCQNVLAKNFPNVTRYRDIKYFDGTKYRGQVDVLSGGFPCQPFSVAGNQQGANDERFLWPEMLRAIREIQPCNVVAENVYGLLNQGGGMVFEQVCAEMENEGYEVLPVIIPACAVNAPHERQRMWIIAYSDGLRREGGNEKLQEKQFDGHDAPHSASKLWERYSWKPDELPAPAITRTNDGLQNRMDRIKALGNAIVPQVAYELFKVIETVAKLSKNVVTQ